MQLFKVINRTPLWISSAILTVVLTGLFLGLSYASSSIPDEAVFQNVVTSEKLILEENDDLLYIPLFHFDKFDGEMIGMTAMEDSLGVFHKVLLNPEVSTPPSVINYIRHFSPDSLSHPQVTPYGRYWHGCQTFLKPMLLAGDYHNIKMFNYIAFFAMLMLTVIMLSGRLSWQIGVILQIALLAVGIVFVPHRIHTACCFYVCYAAIVAMLTFSPRRFTDKFAILFFYVVGAVTTYFDQLSTPLITLCIPLSIMLIYRPQPARISSTIKIMVAWTAGYVILWGMKWLLATIFTNYNMFADAWNQILFRTDGGGWQLSWGKGFYPLFSYLSYLLFMLIILTAGFCFIKVARSQRRLLLSLMLIAILPYIWFFTFRNHSFIHYHFVWRLIAIPIFNLLLTWYLILRNLPESGKYGKFLRRWVQ